MAFGGSLNVSTGLDGSGNLITTDLGCDAHWTTQFAGACGNGIAQVVMSSDPDWYSGWAVDGPNSNWVTVNASVTNNGVPAPNYSLVFYLTDTIGATLSGVWGVDDNAQFFVNGNLLDTEGCCSFTHSFSVPNADLLSGANTITLATFGSDSFLEAVRVEGTLIGDGASFTSAPEPGTLALIGAALALIARRLRP
jgi:hypothetical protein